MTIKKEWITVEGGRKDGGPRRLCVMTCRHGERIECWDFTNSCARGCDFNSSGQQLAPRSQWGEETGETYTDIMLAQAEGFRGDYDY